MDDIHRWHWLLSPSLGLLHRQGHIWLLRQPFNHVHRSCRYKSQTSHYDQPLPADIQRATVHRSRTGECTLTGTSHSVSTLISHPPSVLRAWSEAERQCTEFYGWVPDELEIQGSEAILADALAANTLRIVGDGSYDNMVGTAAIQLLTKCGKHRLHPRTRCPSVSTSTLAQPFHHRSGSRVRNRLAFSRSGDAQLASQTLTVDHQAHRRHVRGWQVPQTLGPRDSF